MHIIYREHAPDGSTYPCCGKGSFAEAQLPEGERDDPGRDKQESRSQHEPRQLGSLAHDTAWHRPSGWCTLGGASSEQMTVISQLVQDLAPHLRAVDSMELGQQSLPVEVRQTTNPNSPLTFCHFPNILHEQMSATCQTCHLTSSHLKDPIHFAAHIWKSRFTNVTTSISGKQGVPFLEPQKGSGRLQSWKMSF